MPVGDHVIVPDWPAPARVHALQTTRGGGFSRAPYDSLNLGDHVGDDPLAVAANRQSLNGLVPGEPLWLRQVHGSEVVLAEAAGCMPSADAAVSRCSNAVCAVMTADCLPVFFCDDAASVVGVAHAGWRGLAAGVLEATIRTMRSEPRHLMAWLGPAIGPRAFEVGDEVRAAFTGHAAMAAQAFVPAADGKWLADIYLLARQRLRGAGVARVYGGEYCTYTDAQRFFSYRRNGRTGRMASLIWLAD